MRVVLIGALYNLANSLVGFRFLDPTGESKTQIMDIDKQSVYNTLLKGIRIEGLEIKGGKITGSNGNISRYPAILPNNTLLGSNKSPLIVLNELLDNGDIVGYIISDFCGNIKTAKVDVIVDYASKFGIANGKVVTKDNKKFISPIRGKYITKEIKSKPAETVSMTIKEFEDYMNSNGYQYNFLDMQIPEDIDYKYFYNIAPKEYKEYTDKKILKGLGQIDSRVKKLIIPEGVEAIGLDGIDLFDNEYASECEEIYLPSTLLIVYGTSNLTKLHKIHCHPKASTIFLNFAFSLDDCINFSSIKDATIELPKTDIQTASLCNNWRHLKDLELSKYSIRSMKNSFNEIGEIDKFSLPRNLVYLISSFNKSAIRYIKIPSTLVNVLNSFSFMFDTMRLNQYVGYEAEIDFSEATSLREIGSKSFNIPIKKELKFPESLRSISNACFIYYENDNLSLPKYLKSIGSSSFLKTFLKKLEVYSGIYIGLNAFKLIENLYIKCDESDKDRVGNFESLNMMNVFIEKGIERINTGAFSNSSMHMLTFETGSKLYKIEECAFKNCGNLKEINEIPNSLRVINDQAFCNCAGLRKLILQEGLTTIGSSCFEHCTNLKYLVVPRTVTTIGRKGLIGCGGKYPYGTLFIVYKKSFAENYCKRNKLNYKSISNKHELSELINDLEAEIEVNETLKTKLSVLLSEDDVLLQDKYINNAKKIMRIRERLSAEENYDTDILKINTDKLINVDFKSIDIVKEFIYNDILHSYSKQNVIKSSEDNTIESSSFNGILNLLTEFTYLDTRLFNTNTIQYIRSNHLGVGYNELISVNTENKFDKTILKVGIRDSKTDSEYNVFVAMKNNKIIYMTSIDYNENNTFCYTQVENTNIGVVKVDEILEIGDFIFDSFNVPTYTTAWEAILGGVAVPDELGKKAISILFGQSLILELKLIKDHVLSNNSAKCDIIIYNHVTGNIIEGISIVRYFGDSFKVEKVRYLVSEVTTLEIKDIYKLEKMQTRNKKAYDRIKQSFSCNNSNRLFSFISKKEEERLSELMKSNMAYDNEPCFEFEVGEILKLANIESKKQLTSPVLDLLTDTVYAEKTNKRYAQIVSIIDSVTTDIHTVDGVLYSQYRTKKVQNVDKLISLRSSVILFKKDEYKPGSMVEVAYLGEPIDSMVKQLRLLGDTTSKSYDKVIDEAVDLDDFLIVAKSSLHYIEGLKCIAYCRLYIGINKASGHVFLLGSKEDRQGNKRVDTRILFRLKDCEGIAKWFSWFNNPGLLDERNLHTFANDLIWMTNELAINIRSDINEYYESGLDLKEIRQMIIDGMPNGYMTRNKYQEFFDYVAKQPK